VCRERRHALALKDRLDKRAMSARDHRLELIVPDACVTLAHEPFWHGEIHPVRSATNVLVDPAELDLELVRTEGERPEHPKTTRFAHRGDDVTAM
jgi:hypothetical protein